MTCKQFAINKISAALSWLNYQYLNTRYKNVARPERIIWVDPNSIYYSIEFSELAKKRLFYIRGLVIGGDWDRTGYTVLRFHRNLFKYLSCKLRDIEPPLNTSDMIRLDKKYDAGLLKKYKALYETVCESGFSLPNSRLGIDPFYIGIGRDGEYFFITGKHRLAIAKAARRKIPAVISFRHANWQKTRDDYLMNSRASERERGKLSETIINHPDLN